MLYSANTLAFNEPGSFEILLTTGIYIPLLPVSLPSERVCRISVNVGKIRFEKGGQDHGDSLGLPKNSRSRRENRRDIEAS